MAHPENPKMTEANLRDMYWGSSMSLSEIARECGLRSGSAVLYHMKKHGIERREAKPPANDYACYFIDKQDDYARWADWVSGERVGVHQLLAIADGEDPYEVFDEDNVVHHISGHSRDDRPGNVEVMSRSDHNRIHRGMDIPDCKRMAIQSVKITQEARA